MQYTTSVGVIGELSLQEWPSPVAAELPKVSATGVIPSKIPRHDSSLFTYLN